MKKRAKKHRVSPKGDHKSPSRELRTVAFTFKGEPLTKSNNYFFKGHIFVPTKIRKYEKSLKDYAKSVMQKTYPNYGLLDRSLHMTIHYYLGTKRRKDIVNLPKTTTDALNEAVYEDDSQIAECHIFRHLDRKNPRLEIVISEMDDTLWQAG